MVVASVRKFIDKIQKYDEKSVVTVPAYTGFGDVGFFKLEMKFGKQTKVITKCETTAICRYIGGLFIGLFFWQAKAVLRFTKFFCLYIIKLYICY